MENNLKKLEELKKLGNVKIKFIPENYHIDGIEMFVKNFILNDKQEVNDESQRLFDIMYSLIMSLYSIRKDEYDKVMLELKTRLNLDGNDFISFRDILTNGIEETLKNLCKNDMEKEKLEKDFRIGLLSTTYNVENTIQHLKKVINFFSENRVEEILKEENNDLRNIATIFCLINDERPNQYKNLIDILKSEIKAENREEELKKINYFEETILNSFGKYIADNLEESEKLELIQYCKDCKLFSFENIDVEITVETEKGKEEEVTKKINEFMGQ